LSNDCAAPAHTHEKMNTEGSTEGYRRCIQSNGKDDQDDREEIGITWSGHPAQEATGHMEVEAQVKAQGKNDWLSLTRP